MATKVSKAPYNFIGLENFVLNRCNNEDDIINHDRYGLDLNTGYVDYEIEVITPLHISRGKIEELKRGDEANKDFAKNESHLFKNPEGKYAIPGNTVRGMTRFNASIFAFSSVINDSIKKKDIVNQRFYYRTHASIDKAINKWYRRKVGYREVTVNNYTFSVLDKVEAGYIRKDKDGYKITPAFKYAGKSYFPIHEYELKQQLKKYYIKGFQFLYNGELEREDYKNKELLQNKRNNIYKPYFYNVRYNIADKKAYIDRNGSFGGCLMNSKHFWGKVHHYLIFSEDKRSPEIKISKEQAELYTDDMKYTHKQDPNGNRSDNQNAFYELPKDNEVKPVFYIKDKDYLIFGFTPYLRLPADGDIYAGIPETHRNYSGRDFVDSIFGWQEFRSKVSFLDALCISPEVPTVKYTMVLGQPKPSWYKGYIKQEKDNELQSYCSENFKIRGRKFYWLKESADVEAMKLNNNDNLNTTMYCYKEGTKFAGKVRFENLNNEELGLLLFSLRQGDTEGYFNIGMGKPYGLGKCRIKIKQLVLYDIRGKYMSFNGNAEKAEDIENYISDFKEYVRKHYKTDNLNDIGSYKEYALSKKIIKNSEARYMDLKEFKNKAELPSAEEVAAGKKLSDRMGK